MANQGRSVRSSEEIVARANERIRGTFAGVLGMEFTHLAPERVEATLKVRQELKQPWGIVHGGAVMTLADTVATLSFRTRSPPREAGGASDDNRRRTHAALTPPRGRTNVRG